MTLINSRHRCEGGRYASLWNTQHESREKELLPLSTAASHTALASEVENSADTQQVQNTTAGALLNNIAASGAKHTDANIAPIATVVVNVSSDNPAGNSSQVANT